MLRTRQNELMEKVNEQEKQLKTFRGSREEINNDLHQIDIRVAGFDSESQSITTRISEDYDLDVKTVDVGNPDETLSREEASRRQHELKDLLKNFGAVNLLALEEYKTASEREAFLGVQLADLGSAKSDLQATINKINQTARELFEDTLAKVRINFKKLFTELFTGGEADIYLKDPSDPLESDIEIFARPKGKKLVSITMMSGGERALTAISLLFSLYMVKPSPFCILDEIDAPLDDANCRRFLKIIDTFSDQTQFIMITHNKITMEASHNLYGVTMEQLGISKLVAVKFNEVHEDGSFELEQSREPLLESVPETIIDEFSLEEELVSEDDNGNGNGHGNGNGKKDHEPVEELVDFPIEDIEIVSSPDELSTNIVNRVAETISTIADEDAEIQE